MDWFKIIKNNYDAGYYTKDQVKDFVSKGKITADQYKTITGESYSS